MKRMLCLAFLLNFLPSSIIHSVIQNDYQDIDAILAENINKIKTPEFQKETLPYDFSYLINFLKYGNKTEQPRAYSHLVIKLFTNLLKGAEYVNTYAFSTLLEQLPILLKHNFVIKGIQNNKMLFDVDMLDRLKETVNALLYTKFSSEFEIFKKEPEQFLANISRDIVQEIFEEERAIEQLRYSVILFLEIGLNKLIWSPKDAEKTWQSVKKISHQLATLMENNILDDANVLDDLFLTLTHRFCYFLDITGTDLPIAFYEKVKSDINKNQLLIFALEEQDTSLLESKSNQLTRSLLQAEARCRAYKKGIVTH